MYFLSSDFVYFFLLFSWVFSLLSLLPLQSINPLIPFQSCDYSFYLIEGSILDCRFGELIHTLNPFLWFLRCSFFPKYEVAKEANTRSGLFFLPRIFQFSDHFFILFSPFIFNWVFFFLLWGLCFSFFRFYWGFATCNCSRKWFSWFMKL